MRGINMVYKIAMITAFVLTLSSILIVIAAAAIASDLNRKNRGQNEAPTIPGPHRRSRK